MKKIVYVLNIFIATQFECKKYQIIALKKQQKKYLLKHDII